MRRFVVAVMATLLSLVGAMGVISAPADARSYEAKAVKKVNQWAYYRYRSALYIETQCYGVGYRRADCTVYLTKSASACSVAVLVSGRNFKIRKYDTTC